MITCHYEQKEAQVTPLLQKPKARFTPMQYHLMSVLYNDVQMDQ